MTCEPWSRRRQAIVLIDERAAKGPSKGKKKAPAKKAAPKKAAAKAPGKKSAAKKPAAKRTPAKKLVKLAE